MIEQRNTVEVPCIVLLRCPALHCIAFQSRRFHGGVVLRLEGDSDRGDVGPGCPVITSDPTDQSSFTNDSSSCSTNSSSSGRGRSEITSTRAKTVERPTPLITTNLRAVPCAKNLEIL